MAADRVATPGNALQVPEGWDAPACLAWARGDSLGAIQAALAAWQARPGAAAALQVACYLFQRGDFDTACQVMAQQLPADPQHLALHLNLGVCHGRAGRPATALPHLDTVLARQPDLAAALDARCACLWKLGRFAEAAATGTRILAIKDRDSRAGWPVAPLGDACVADRLAAARDLPRVLAFSLWGDNPRYLRGALQNQLLAPVLYPGWACRFHVDASVPADLRDALAGLGADLRMHPADEGRAARLARRFAVANDPSVGWFAVRDCDSVPSLREARAVEDWQASGQPFHVMRDWWSHTDLMLAGMWGGVSGLLPDLGEALRTYEPPDVETANIDQWFLRDRVWPHVRGRVCVHDRCFAGEGHRAWPGAQPVGMAHVGQDEHALATDAQATWLAPWATRVPSLRLLPS